MDLVSPSENKHDLSRDLSGVGAASAAAIMVVLAANPPTSFLTAGILGRITFWILSTFFTKLASAGLVVLNVGAEKFSSALDRVKFDGSIDSAEKLIAEIRRTGKELTPEEIKAIDDPVIEAFKQFATIARKQ